MVDSNIKESDYILIFIVSGVIALLCICKKICSCLCF